MWSSLMTGRIAGISDLKRNRQGDFGRAWGGRNKKDRIMATWKLATAVVLGSVLATGSAWAQSGFYGDDWAAPATRRPSCPNGQCGPNVTGYGVRGPVVGNCPNGNCGIVPPGAMSSGYRGVNAANCPNGQCSNTAWGISGIRNGSVGNCPNGQCNKPGYGAPAYGVRPASSWSPQYGLGNGGNLNRSAMPRLYDHRSGNSTNGPRYGWESNLDHTNREFGSQNSPFYR